MIGTTNSGDNLYFEVTYSSDRDEWYLDVYDKKHNFNVYYDANDDLIVKEQHDYDL